jgi:hypothetical protein
MTSALDQIDRPPAARAGAADFVLECADRAAVAWRGRLRRGSPELPIRRLVLPLLLAGVGAYLHLLPGADSGGTAPPAAATAGTEADTSEPEKDEEGAAGLLAWRQVGAEPDPAHPASTGLQRGAHASSATPGATGDTSAEEFSDLAEGAASAPIDPSNEAAQAAGEQPGSSRASLEGLLEAGDPFEIEVSYLEIPQADADLAGADSGRAIEARSIPKEPGLTKVAAPARQHPAAARSALPPALRAYVAHFLNEIRERPR